MFDYTFAWMKEWQALPGCESELLTSPPTADQEGDELGLGWMADPTKLTEGVVAAEGALTTAGIPTVDPVTDTYWMRNSGHIRMYTPLQVVSSTVQTVNRWCEQFAAMPGCSLYVPSVCYKFPSVEGTVECASNVLPMPSSRSFHLTLHRYLSGMLITCTNSDQLTSCVRLALQNMGQVDNSDPDKKHNCGMIYECPINTLLWCMQIRANVWVLNGQSMLEQALHYSDPPYHNNGRLMDVFLVQCYVQAHAERRALMTQNCNDSGNIFAEMLFKLNLGGYITHCCSHASAFDYCTPGDIPPADTAHVLIEDVLTTTIQLVSEIPQKAIPKPEYVLRQEQLHHSLIVLLVNILVIAPSTYSSLQDAVIAFGTYEDWIKDINALSVEGLSILCTVFCSEINISYYVF